MDSRSNSIDKRIMMIFLRTVKIPKIPMKNTINAAKIKCIAK